MQSHSNVPDRSMRYVGDWISPSDQSQSYVDQRLREADVKATVMCPGCGGTGIDRAGTGLLAGLVTGPKHAQAKCTQCNGSGRVVDASGVMADALDEYGQLVAERAQADEVFAANLQDREAALDVARRIAMQTPDNPGPAGPNRWCFRLIEMTKAPSLGALGKPRRPKSRLVVLGKEQLRAVLLGLQRGLVLRDVTQLPECQKVGRFEIEDKGCDHCGASAGEGAQHNTVPVLLPSAKGKTLDQVRREFKSFTGGMPAKAWYEGGQIMVSTMLWNEAVLDQDMYVPSMDQLWQAAQWLDHSTDQDRDRELATQTIAVVKRQIAGAYLPGNTGRPQVKGELPTQEVIDLYHEVREATGLEGDRLLKWERQRVVEEVGLPIRPYAATDRAPSNSAYAHWAGGDLAPLSDVVSRSASTVKQVMATVGYLQLPEVEGLPSRRFEVARMLDSDRRANGLAVLEAPLAENDVAVYIQTVRHLGEAMRTMSKLVKADQDAIKRKEDTESMRSARGEFRVGEWVMLRQSVWEALSIVGAAERTALAENPSNQRGRVIENPKNAVPSVKVEHPDGTVVFWNTRDLRLLDEVPKAERPPEIADYSGTTEDFKLRMARAVAEQQKAEAVQVMDAPIVEDGPVPKPADDAAAPWWGDEYEYDEE